MLRRNFLFSPLLFATEAYTDAIEAWRAGRLARLRSEDGWLSLVGLHWLEPGTTTFGADPANDIVLPSGPKFAGTIEVRNGSITAGGKPVQPDRDTFTAGSLILSVIERGGRLALRVKDPNSSLRLGFKGLKYFPIAREWRVVAEWVSDPRKLRIASVTGTASPMHSPGIARFQAEGRNLTLRPVLESPGAQELFFIFRDLTSRKETYGAGRFLYSEMPKNGKLILDFNKAYNPPCAFTPYSTCPLPPKENVLPIRIEAGEMRYEPGYPAGLNGFVPLIWRPRRDRSAG